MAATSAARLHAASATLRVGYSPDALSADRNERQTVHPPRTSRARVIVEVELEREDRERTAPAKRRGGPSPLFLAQYFAQETASAGGDAVVQSQAAARYPSLGFEHDILLPGDATALVAVGPRVDILV